MDLQLPAHSTMTIVLVSSQFNWFQLVENVEEMTDRIALKLPVLLTTFSPSPTHLELTQKQMELTVHSHRAFVAATSASYEEDRNARVINGEVVSESESEDSQEFDGVKRVIDQAGKSLVRKRRMAIKRRARRLRTKLVAEKRFLSKKIS